MKDHHTALRLKGKKELKLHDSFSKKDTIIRNVEIVTFCVSAFIVAAGIYQILK